VRIFGFIAAKKAEHSISIMCRVLVERAKATGQIRSDVGQTDLAGTTRSRARRRPPSQALLQRVLALWVRPRRRRH
jgi:hypothetical protein